MSVGISAPVAVSINSPEKSLSGILHSRPREEDLFKNEVTQILDVLNLQKIKDVVGVPKSEIIEHVQRTHPVGRLFSLGGCPLLSPDPTQSPEELKAFFMVIRYCELLKCKEDLDFIRDPVDTVFDLIDAFDTTIGSSHVFYFWHSPTPADYSRVMFNTLERIRAICILCMAPTSSGALLRSLHGLENRLFEIVKNRKLNSVPVRIVDKDELSAVKKNMDRFKNFVRTRTALRAVQPPLAVAPPVAVSVEGTQESVGTSPSSVTPVVAQPSERPVSEKPMDKMAAFFFDRRKDSEKDLTQIPRVSSVESVQSAATGSGASSADQQPPATPAPKTRSMLFQKIFKIGQS